MNLTRCENGHFYDKEKYKFCPHCEDVESDTVQVIYKETNSPLMNGFRSLRKWLQFTVFLSGIPLIFFTVLCIVFGYNSDKGLTELAAFFFGIVTPVIFDQQINIGLYNNELFKGIKFIIVFSFIIFCMFYGGIYMMDFRKEVMTIEQLASSKFVVSCFGIGCFVLTGIAHFCGGYYAEQSY